jgi:hypothetical protein
MCIANADASLFCFILLMCSLYLTFSDLSVCPTYALLQTLHVNRLSDFGVMLSKLLIVFIVLYAIFMFMGLKSLVIVYR